MPATTSEARPAMYTVDNHQPRALDVAYRTALSNLVAPYGYFFYDPADVGNLISGSSAFSKTSLNIWKFMVHVLLKPGLENFEH